MYNNTNSQMTPAALETQQRAYLLDREDEVSSLKLRELRKQFYLDDETPPATPKELRERLTSGRFEIQGEDKNEFPCYQSAKGSLKWRDPAKPADEVGYGTAQEAVEVERTKVRDDIRVAPVMDALASLRAFESTTLN